MKTSTIALVYLLSQHVVVDAQLANVPVPIKRRRYVSPTTADRITDDILSSSNSKQQQQVNTNTARLLKTTRRRNNKARLLKEEGSMSITTDESMSILIGGSNNSFLTSSTGLNAPIAKHIATCIDQPVFDIYGIYDEDVPFSPLTSSVLDSKVVGGADNGTCDISMIDNGLSLKMTYHPKSSYVGQDKCEYVMCTAEECRHVMITINVEDCSVAEAKGHVGDGSLSMSIASQSMSIAMEEIMFESMSLSLKGTTDWWSAVDSTGEDVVVPQLRPSHQSSKTSKAKAKCTTSAGDIGPKFPKSSKCKMKTISVAQGYGSGSGKSGKSKASLDILPTPVPQFGTSGSTKPVVLHVADDCTIDDIEVEIKIEHTFAGDLDINLESPCGETANLVFNQGGGSDLSASAPIAFNDKTGVSLASFPAGGTYISQGSRGVMLSDITGGTFGNWTLNIFDIFGGDSGTLRAVNLTIDAICCR